jgi:uncharacterized YigZ family protein
MDSIKKEHPTASHIVYAYRLKSSSGTLYEKYSDAGEPSGTAGKPTLYLLQKKEVVRGGIFTVRYFGGVKLGKGGLLRAYSESAKLAMENALISEIVSYQKLTFCVNYSQFEIMEREIQKRGIKFLTKDFGSQVTCMIQYRLSDTEDIINYFSELGIQSYAIID